MVKKILLVAFFSSLIITSTTYAALYIYLKSYPAFSISQAADSELTLAREELLFKIDQQTSEQAIVTAKYTLMNPEPENITVPIVLPYLAVDPGSITAEAVFNGQAVGYTIRGVGFLERQRSEGDFLLSRDEFKAQVDINMMIENLYQPSKGRLQDNIYLLLFKLDFPAESASTLTLQYPIEAAMDRSESRDFVNIFSYIFDPATMFNEYGGVDIRIELNEKYPFVIDSSLPLDQIAPGIYITSLDEMPAQDLIFTTYSKQQVTRFEHFLNWLEPRLFWVRYLTLILLIYGGGALLVIFVFVYIFKKKKNQR